MTWDEIGRNVGDRIFDLEKQIEDMKEASYDASFTMMGSYNTGGDGESPEGVTGSTNVLRGAVTLSPTLCRRIDGEPIVEGGSNVSDTIQVVNPYQIVKPKGTENPINIKWIDKASHDGQILILEPFYKHPTADNSDNTTAYSLVLKTAGNIDIASDTTIAKGEKITLQWTENIPITNSTSGSWKIVSQSSASSGSDISLDGTNTWTGHNNFNHTTVFGDASSDTVTFYGSIRGKTMDIPSPTGSGTSTGMQDMLEVDANLNMKTYNIYGLDQLIFANPTNSTNSSSPTWNTSHWGLEIESDDLRYRVPSADEHRFYVGSDLKLTINSSEIEVNDQLTINNSATPTSTSTAISALSGNMYYNVPSNDSHYFQLGGNIKFEVNDVIDTRRNDVVNVKRAIFDEDDDTFIAGEHYTSTDDVLEFYTNDSLRFKIDNTTTTATGQFSAYGNIILGLTTSNTIQMTGRLTTSIIPMGDNSLDLGSSSREWRNLYVDGIGYIDTISAGTISVTTFSTTGTSNLGNQETDEVNFYGKTDYRYNTTSNASLDIETSNSNVSYNSGVLYPDGWIYIKINGSNKVIPYYDED